MEHSLECEASDQAELDRVLREVEETLSRVSGRICKLNGEVHQAKKEISQVFGRQLVHLHNRQTQLLRQVDVLYRDRGQVLHSQLAHCHRLLGALQTTQQLSDQLLKQKNELTIHGLAGIKKWGMLSPLNWELNEESLSDAIGGFGHVEMDGVLLLPAEEQSKCLPARVEEYPEDEFHFVDKPLHTNVIEIKFPKLPKDYSYWLSCGKNKENERNLDAGYGPYRKARDSYKPCDVQTWLGSILHDTATEPIEQGEQSLPELVSLSDASSCSKESDSIEVVSVSNMFEKSDNTKSVNGCCQQTALDVEIENLAETFTSCLVDKQRWLIPPKPSSGIQISKACRANEMCQSFDACICEKNCYTLAVKKRDEKEKQLNWGKDILPEQLKDSNQSKWLLSTTIATTASGPVESPFSKSHGNEDYTRWLHPSSLNNTLKDNINRQLTAQNCTNWLSKKGDSIPLFNPTISGMPNNLSHWLRSSLNNQNVTSPVSATLQELKLLKSNGKLQTISDNWTNWLLQRK